MIHSACKKYVPFLYTVNRLSSQSYPPQPPKNDAWCEWTSEWRVSLEAPRAKLSDPCHVIVLLQYWKKSFCLCVIPFSEGVACPNVRWLKNACGKRGRCLLDPNVNGFRDCKCLPGHYYQHFYKDLIIAECIGTENNIPYAWLRKNLKACFITKPGFQRVIPCRITSVNSQSSANPKNYISTWDMWKCLHIGKARLGGETFGLWLKHT